MAAILRRLGPRLTQFYVNGEWLAPLSDARLPFIDPATEEEVGSIAMGSVADVERAVAAATAAFDAYAATSKTERLALLRALLVVYEERAEEMAQAISAEMGAPISMARDAQADCGSGHLRGFIDALDEQLQRAPLPSGDVLVREPIGVCGLITPWNWPINQIALKVIPALAAGCTCVLKPSELTPLSAALFAEMVHAAGFPPGVFNLVSGDGMTAGATLSKHADVAMMSFTGSTSAGVAVQIDAAPSVKRVTLELGGKSPNIVFADCGDALVARVEASVAECMYNTGQSCDAPTRLLVERACYDDVVEIAGRAAGAQTVGSPDVEGEHIGPLVSALQWERVQAMIAAGIDEGARLVAGGLGRPEGDAFAKGYYVKPTVFADVDNATMRVAREEIFGPVLVIIPFEDEEEAIAIANDSPYGLAAYVQTGDSLRAERVAARLRAGSVHFNGAYPEYGSPFGGYKLSGNGREGGDMGLEDYQEVKVLHGFGALAT